MSDWGTDYDIFDPAYVDNPFPIWTEVRGKCPIAHTDRWGGSWNPLTYDDVTTMARDIDHFVSGKGISVVPPIPDEEQTGEPIPANGVPPISSDPPLHTWTRRLILPSMAPKRVDEYEVMTRALCRSLVDGFIEKGRADAATSSVATTRAISNGCRYGTIVTLVPKRTFFVTGINNAKMVKASNQSIVVKTA